MKSLLMTLLLLCANLGLSAQSFSSLKKVVSATYNTTLNRLLEQGDVQGMKVYLSAHPAAANDASVEISRKGLGSNPVVTTKPLLFDATERILAGVCPPDMFWIILEAEGGLHGAFDGKTPLYIILDYIATHREEECEVAEGLLANLLGRSDFDVNYRYKDLLPPLPYLIRNNYNYLNKFDKDYISDGVLRLLIEKGASVNTYDSDGNSLMVFAMDAESAYLQRYFIDKGIKLDKKNDSGKDAIYKAISEGRLELVKQLLDAGYELNIGTLKNEPESFRQYTELYDYIAGVCGGKAESYEELMLFRKKMRDKDDLIYTKLYAHYSNEYQKVESARNSITQEIRHNPAEAAQALVARRDALVSPASKFIHRYGDFDPDNKIHQAQDVIDAYAVFDAIIIEVPETYLNLGKHLLVDFMDWVYGTNTIGFNTHKALNDKASIEKGIESAYSFMLFGAFEQGDFFSQWDQELRLRLDRLIDVYNRDIVDWNRIQEQNRLIAERNRAEQQATDCLNCQINFEDERNRLPEKIRYDDIIKNVLFSSDRPGRVYMKNGESFDFWQYDDGTWYISTGLFSNKRFDTFGEMLRYFLNECEKKYCGN